MRRSRQQLSREACDAILQRGTSGVLAVLGDEGYPYAVPLSYCYDGERILFHCAKSGHKLDAIRREEKASFCVIDRDEVIAETYTTHFCSVIAFGRVREITDPQAMRRAITVLADKYAPHETAEHRDRAIDSEWKGLCMLELIPEHVSGKEAIELVRQREKG